MVCMRKMTKRFLTDDDGATLVEYGLLIGLVASVALASVILLAQYVGGAFNKLQSDMAGGGIPQK